MAIGNSISLVKPEDVNQKVFKIDTFKSFVNCMSVLAHFVRERKRKHVLIVSEKKYQYEKVRAAYFCWLKEKYTSADHSGESIAEMHEQYKASYLLPILCRENKGFADLVLKNEGDEKAILRLLSVADGSICTTAIIKEYFKNCQQAG